MQLNARLFRKYALATSMLVGIAQCSTLPEWREFPVEARLMGERTHTTVDSELSRAFVRLYLDSETETLASHTTDAFESGRKNESSREFAAKIQGLLEKYDGRALTTANLNALSAETSPDFATAYYMRRVLERSENRAFQKRFYSHVHRLRDARQRAALTADEKWNRRIKTEYVFLFAPGLLYKSKPETKSDMRPQRELLKRMGFQAELLPVHQAGSVESNARVIADAVRRHRDSRVVLVSASKGGPDVAHALGAELSPDESQNVQAWVNVGGALGGSPLADEMLESWEMPFARIYGWFLGVDACELAESLSVRASRARRLRQKIPERIFVLNYVAVPFSGSVIPEVRGPYAHLRKIGPNDGIVLLSEQSARNSQTILAIGSDHRFQDPEIDIKTLALARIVLEHVEGRPRIRTAARATHSEAAAQ